jgi:hypothetical protein
MRPAPENSDPWTAGEISTNPVARDQYEHSFHYRLCVRDAALAANVAEHFETHPFTGPRLL